MSQEGDGIIGNLMADLTYTNPVYSGYFADPFVWQHEGIYYAVGTGPVPDRSDSKLAELRAFPLLRSHDFVNWESIGGALRVPDFAVGGDFWAPEVAFDNGKFYLYYSVSTEGLNHKLRVAVSSSPEGPFEDVGLLMPHSDDVPFAIDAHPFRDDDGQWYLFYARDFLDQENGLFAGTALVVDRLLNMTILAGEEKVVVRARNNWTLFKAQREMYGKILDWHTLEGPFVRKHEGEYFCFYSGGCYENESYGVDYAVGSSVMGPYADSGNETGARVLKTLAEKVIGPGHHSIAVGPDGRDYLVYHAWDHAMTGRRMCIDLLLWTEEGPRCAGPTWASQTISASS